MKLFACKLLADENIHTGVVDFLRNIGCDVAKVAALGLKAQPDDAILKGAFDEGRIVLTHDRDFGRLAVLGNQALLGIVYLRPGHIKPQFTIATLQVINSQDYDLSPSFILVARRTRDTVQLRLRRWTSQAS